MVVGRGPNAVDPAVMVLLLDGVLVPVEGGSGLGAVEGAL